MSIAKRPLDLALILFFSFSVLYGAFARLLELTLFEGLVPLFFFD